MKTFKNFLSESEMTSMVKKFDATKMSVADILEAMNNGGVNDSDQPYTQVVYGGYSDKAKNHKYYMLWENLDSAEDEDKPFAINAIFVFLDRDGKICADSSGMPDHDGMTKDEAVRKLASLKKS